MEGQRPSESPISEFARRLARISPAALGSASIHAADFGARVVMSQYLAILVALLRAQVRTPLAEADAVAGALGAKDCGVAVVRDLEGERRQQGVADQLAQLDRGQRLVARAGFENDRLRAAGRGARRDAQALDAGLEAPCPAQRRGDLAERNALGPFALVEVGLSAAQVGRGPGREVESRLRALALSAAARAEIRR